MFWKLKKPLVMIIDDDVSIRKLIRASIERMSGFRVIEAVSVTTAFDLMKKERPSVILLDLNLPPQHGFDILTGMRRSKIKKIPTIVMTSDQNMGSLEKALALGAMDYCTKPVRSSDLLVKMKKLMKK